MQRIEVCPVWAASFFPIDIFIISCPSLPIGNFATKRSQTMLYIVTGVKYRSKRRFRILTTNAIHAFAINLWRGSVWKYENGKRTLLRRVYN